MNLSIKPTVATFFRILIVNVFFFITMPSYSCTIFSGIDSNGNVWNANNEDGPKGIANFINVFPKTNNTKYGYYTLSYFSPKNGEGANLQGGMNEAGLTFDFNAIALIEGFELKNKKAFPKGDHAILPHILANMRTVQEVISFFNTYWFQRGFVSAQMHVADANGRFAIISASGVQLVEKGKPLVSTNFNLCSKENGDSCWRYPIATKKINQMGVSLSTMKAICKATAQNKNGIITMYSNIQNLTTGDLWFFSAHDPNVTIHTNINTLIAKGRKSYSFSRLNSLKEHRSLHEKKITKTIVIDKTILTKYTGTYTNMMTGEINISVQDKGLKLSASFAPNEILHPQSNTTFSIPDTPITIKFVKDENNGLMTLQFYEDWYWSFTAWRE